MITTARQLKDLIRNLSKKKSADAQILMRNYMMERFLERISLSEYKNQFILKGGMLVAAMVGLDARATMDLDATIKGTNVSVEDVEMIISQIISIPLDDGVSFRIKRISEIMEEADYPGVRVSMETKFDGVITPLKIDISTGDIITPREIKYNFNLMLENRTIEVWAYNLETVLAEKLETVVSRNVTNTRMRDFYDIYILQKLYGEQLQKQVLWTALVATAKKRGTLDLIEAEDIKEIFDAQGNPTAVLGDTGYPYYIAQFGVVGIILLTISIKNLLKMVRPQKQINCSAILLLIYLCIALTGESTLLNAGVEFAVTLAVILAKNEKKILGERINKI